LWYALLVLLQQYVQAAKQPSKSVEQWLALLCAWLSHNYAVLLSASAARTLSILLLLMHAMHVV
jgi:hypothetical protein